MTEELKDTSRDQWQTLLLRLEADLSKGMVTFVDEDLNRIAMFLHERRYLISEEKYNLAIEILNACARKIWLGENTDIFKGLFNGIQLPASAKESGR